MRPSMVLTSISTGVSPTRPRLVRHVTQLVLKYKIKNPEDWEEALVTSTEEAIDTGMADEELDPTRVTSIQSVTPPSKQQID